MTVEPDTPDARILQSIVAGMWPWSCLVGVALREAELSGPAAATDALARLEAGGWLERWELPAVPGEKGQGGRAGSTQVTLTPWAMVWCGVMIVENQTEERAWYGYEGQLPREYKMPQRGRAYHLSDPRMAATVASLGTTRGEDEAEDDEYLMDRATGELVTMWGRPVAIASSWNRAAKAAKRRTIA